MSDTLTILAAALEHEPGDAITRLVYADALEESGQSLEADYQRWHARHVKCDILMVPDRDEPTGFMKLPRAELWMSDKNMKVLRLDWQKFILSWIHAMTLGVSCSVDKSSRQTHYYFCPCPPHTLDDVLRLWYRHIICTST